MTINRGKKLDGHSEVMTRINLDGSVVRTTETLESVMDKLNSGQRFFEIEAVVSTDGRREKAVIDTDSFRTAYDMSGFSHESGSFLSLCRGGD